MFLLTALTLLTAAVVVTVVIPESELARGIFRLICHGRQDRALIVSGAAMPLCARCVGIYAGLIAACAATLVAGWRLRVSTVVLLLAVAPLAIDGLTQAAGLRESVNTLRVATGLLAGFFFSAWALSRMRQRSGSAVEKAA